MARGNVEGRSGRRSRARDVVLHAGQLAALRKELDGMSADDPAFEPTLAAAIQAGSDLLGSAPGMNTDGLSRRARCANIVTTSEMLAKERNSHMVHNNNAAPQYEQGGDEASRPHLYLVSEASGAAAVAAVTHYEDSATGLDQMPFTD